MTALLALAALALWAGVTTVLVKLTDHAEAHHLVRPRPAPTAPHTEDVP
ncbi:hypothetical protein [Streptomyces sp. NPDC000931]